MTTFDSYLRTILEQAGREAQGDGSLTIEAQHVLLAMASQSDTETGRFLRSLGLDHRALRAALDYEFEHTLKAAGVSLEASASQRAQRSANPAVPLGTSVRHALERGLEGVRRAPTPAHLLLGVLRADVGIVPRALALAGFDRSDLLARVRESLAAE
jgi:ATP-dependent Clp protease ATP-binding subunit ClpA